MGIATSLPPAEGETIIDGSRTGIPRRPWCILPRLYQLMNSDCNVPIGVFKVRSTERFGGRIRPSGVLIREWFIKTGKQTVSLAPINKTVLWHFPVPLLVAAKQKRIVAKVDEPMRLCDESGVNTDAIPNRRGGAHGGDGSSPLRLEGGCSMSHLASLKL